MVIPRKKGRKGKPSLCKEEGDYFGTGLSVKNSAGRDVVSLCRRWEAREIYTRVRRTYTKYPYMYEIHIQNINISTDT